MGTHLQTYTDTYQPLETQWDLNELLRLALITSYHHDKTIQTVLGGTFLKTEESWVITQYNIQILVPIFEAKEMTITTHLIEANRFFVTRKFIVKMDGVETHHILAQFAIINLTTRKMVRVPIQALQNLDLIVPTADKLTTPKPLVTYTEHLKESKRIYPEDIDENLHVNNRVYLRWALAAVPREIATNCRLKEIQIKYGSELRAEDTVELTTTYHHGEVYQTITNLTLTKDACYVKMSWEQVEGGN